MTDPEQVEGQMPLPFEFATDPDNPESDFITPAVVDPAARQHAELIAQLNTQLAQLQADNNTTYSKLVSSGVPVEPSAVVALRLGALIDHLLGSDSRLAFELSYERLLRAALERTAAEAGQPSMTTQQ